MLGGLALNGSNAFFLPLTIDAGNITNTYINFKYAGAVNDWCFLRQIGGDNSYKLVFDFHDDGNDARFAIRNIQSTSNPDIVTEVFTVDNGNVSCTGTLNVGVDLNVIGNYFWKPSKNFRLQATGNGQEFSIDLENQNSYTGCYWQVWSDKLGMGTILACRGDTGLVGIGTSAPITSLHVSGTSLFTNNGTFLNNLNISVNVIINNNASFINNLNISGNVIIIIVQHLLII